VRLKLSGELFDLARSSQLNSVYLSIPSRAADVLWVSQPRDRDERACYAIYRRDTQDILWRRVSYDISGAQKAIIDAGLPAYFAQRLQLGK
jgi:hypothetical protein